MINLIKYDLQKYYKYIGSYLIVIYVSMFAIYKLENLYQYDLNKFLEYALNFSMAVFVILLVVSTLFNIFYFSTSPTLRMNQKANIYYRVFGFNVYVLFVALNFLICSITFFGFDITKLFNLPFHTYLGMLFLIVPLNNLLACAYFKLTINKFIESKIHVLMLVLTFVLIFLSGYGYYYSFYQYAGYGLILSMLPLIIVFKQSLKSKIFPIIIIGLCVIIGVFNTMKNENIVENESEIKNVETSEKLSYSVDEVNTVFGTMKMYRTGNEKIYVNDQMQIRTYNEKSIEIEVENDNPLLHSSISIYKDGKEHSFYVYENSKMSLNKYKMCEGEYTYDGLMKSSCLSSELKNTIELIVKNDYKIIK